jgi:hypothetical protein
MKYFTVSCVISSKTALTKAVLWQKGLQLELFCGKKVSSWSLFVAKRSPVGAVLAKNGSNHFFLYFNYFLIIYIYIYTK